jgi:dihydroorotase
MKAILKKCRIVDPTSKHHGKICDILIEDGVIRQISSEIKVSGIEEISSPNLHVSTGWVDLFSTIPDPGNEQRETLQSGAASASEGGFTTVFITPNTTPTISTKSQVEYVLGSNRGGVVDILPMGSISKNCQGKELAEMYDMNNSGATVFSDGWNPIQHPNMMIKALLYAMANNTLIIQIPDEQDISAHGLINEGIISTQMGLPGKPSIAEELMISRDIELLRYTGSKMHITGVSTEKGLEMIKKAKAEGLQITCSVTPYHLYFQEEDLHNYDTNLKVNPPIRNRSDRDALRKGILDGSIDCIATHHMPMHWDDKQCEFEYAKYGMIGWETCFSVLVESVGYADELIEKLATKPRSIAQLKTSSIEEGASACLTLFDPSIDHEYVKEEIKSISKNSPFIAKTLKGKVIGIINNNKFNRSL